MLAQFWPGGEQPLTANPSFQLAEPALIEISTDEAGSYLGYQVVEEGDTLSSQWGIYTGAVKLEDQQELYAIAHRKGYLPSQIVKCD